MTEGISFTGDPADTQRNLDKMVRDAQVRMQQFSAVREEVQSATVTASSGVARATVQATGALTDLVISEQAANMKPAQIASHVLTAVQRAQAGIQGKVREIVTEHDAVDDAAGQAVVNSFAGRYPEPADVPAAANYREPQEMRFGNDDWDHRGSR